MTEYLTLTQAAARADMKRQHLHRFIKDGRLAATKQPYSGILLIRLDDLLTFLSIPRVTGRPRKD